MALSLPPSNSTSSASTFTPATFWVYVDGFNLYNGALARTSYKWLDLFALACNLQPRDTIGHVKFFSARVMPRVTDPDQDKRQILYWRALRASGHVEIIEGQFRSRDKSLPITTSCVSLETQAARGINVVGRSPRMERVRKIEEKGTDVNLATHLVHDAHMGRYDAALVISNDSDLAGAIAIVRKEVGKIVGVYSPRQNQRLQVIREAASFYREITPKLLRQSQFAPHLSDAQGNFSKPATW
jgi:uncharacterized LabA/DUF88 family protein